MRCGATRAYTSDPVSNRPASYRSWVRSHPAAVDDPHLRGAGAAVVGGEPEDHAGDVGRVELLRQALVTLDGGLGLGRHPVRELALGHDPAGDHAVDADAVGAELAGERARQALDRR